MLQHGWTLKVNGSLSKWKKTNINIYKLYEPIYMKYSKQANAYKQKADVWLPEAEVREE